MVKNIGGWNRNDGRRMVGEGEGASGSFCVREICPNQNSMQILSDFYFLLLFFAQNYFFFIAFKFKWKSLN